MTRSPLVPLLLAGMFFPACNSTPCITAGGPNVQRDFTVEEAQGIAVQGAIAVTLVPGASTSVTASGPRAAVDLLRADVKGQTLQLAFEGCFLGSDTLKVQVTLPELQRASVQGSGSITSSELWSNKDLDVTVAGSGSIYLRTSTSKHLSVRVEGSGRTTISGSAEKAEVDVTGSGRTLLSLSAKQVDVKVSGSGKAELQGQAQELEVEVSGSGRVFATELEVAEADISISGSGQVEAHVLNTLEADVTGSGKVRYKGNPQVRSSISGSGSIDPAP